MRDIVSVKLESLIVFLIYLSIFGHADLGVGVGVCGTRVVDSVSYLTLSLGIQICMHVCRYVCMRVCETRVIDSISYLPLSLCMQICVCVCMYV